MLCSVSTTDAHILKTDGQIKAEMHIVPFEGPVANQPAQLFFEIEDESGRFSFEECDCKVSILIGGKEISAVDLRGESVSVTFPEKGAYGVVFSGKPKTHDAFPVFSIKYDVVVNIEGTGTPSQIPASVPAEHEHSVHIWQAIFSALGVYAFVEIVFGDRKWNNKL